MASSAASLVHLEPAEPFVHVGHKARLSVFAVIDHVYAKIDLPPHDLSDCLTQPRLIFVLIESPPRLLCLHYFEQVGRPRKAPDMGSEDALGAAFHGLALFRLT